MHYGDKEQIDKNKLVIVVYKHSIIGEDIKCDYIITSIQKCEYFHPMLLYRFFKKPNKYLDFLKNEKAEEWYLIKMKCLDGYEKIEILSIINVSKSKDEFLKLH